MDDHRRDVDAYLVSPDDLPRAVRPDSRDVVLGITARGVDVDAVRNGGGDALGGGAFDLPKFVTGDGVVGRRPGRNRS